MKSTASAIFIGNRRYFGVVAIEFSTLTTNPVQTTTSNSTHGPNRKNDMVQLGSGRFIWRNRHQKLFWWVICHFSGAKHASSRNSLQIEWWPFDFNPATDHTNRTNTTFLGREAVSDEINVEYHFLRQMSDFGHFWGNGIWYLATSCKLSVGSSTTT